MKYVPNIVYSEDSVAFRLGDRSCSDGTYWASRADVTKAIRSHGSFRIRLHAGVGGYVENLTVSADISFNTDKLRLGCRVFDKPASKIILKWAGIKEKS